MRFLTLLALFLSLAEGLTDLVVVVVRVVVSAQKFMTTVREYYFIYKYLFLYSCPRLTKKAEKRIKILIASSPKKVYRNHKTSIPARNLNSVLRVMSYVITIRNRPGGSGQSRIECRKKANRSIFIFGFSRHTLVNFCNCIQLSQEVMNFLVEMWKRLFLLFVLGWAKSDVCYQECMEKCIAAFEKVSDQRR